MTSKHASEVRTEINGIIPTDESLIDSFEATLDDDHKAYLQAIDYSVQPIGMRSKMGSKINEKTKEMFENIIFHTSDTQTILDNVVAEVKSELE